MMKAVSDIESVRRAIGEPVSDARACYHGRRVYAANLALRFALELCALAALGYWGFTTDSGTAAAIALGLGAPALAAFLWGAFVAPRRMVETAPPALRLVVEVAVFAGAATALHAAGAGAAGIALAVVWAINKSVLKISAP